MKIEHAITLEQVKILFQQYLIKTSPEELP
jgi:hypothetical protein